MAAGALSGWLFVVMMVIFWGTFSAISVLISRGHGQKDKVLISQVLYDGVMLAIILAIPSFILLRCASQFFGVLGQPVGLETLADTYLHAISWSVLPDFIVMVLFQFLIGLGKTRISMLLTFFLVPLNIVSNYILVFGKWGFPLLGVAGIGWGTAFSYWVIVIILLCYLWFNQEFQPYLRHLFSRQRLLYLKEILFIGLPIGGMFCLELGFFFILTLLMGHFGQQYLVANQLTLQFLNFFSSISFAIAGAITVRIGHILGENNLFAVKRTLGAGVLLAVIMMSIMAIIYWTLPEYLLGIDMDLSQPHNETIYIIAKNLLFFCAFFQLAESIRIAFYGGLRALKDTHFTFITSIISFWCIPLALGWLLIELFQCHGEAYWFGMIIGATTGALILAFRLNKKMNYIV